MTKKEILILAGAAFAEAALALLMGTDLFDVSSWGVRATVAAAQLAAGLFILWGVLRIARARAPLAGALWGELTWFFLFASHIAFLGYLLIPFEVVASAIAIRKRSGAGKGVSVLAAVVARAAQIALQVLLVRLLKHG